MLETGEVIYNDQTVPTPVSYNYTNFNGGPWRYDSIINSTRLYRKGLRRPKPKKLDATPYEILKATNTGISGEWGFDSPDGTVWGRYRGVSPQGYLGDPNLASVRYCNSLNGDFSPDIKDTAYLQALSSLNLKDVDLGAFLKEYGETAQLVGDIADLTVDCLRFLRKRDVGGFINRLRPNVVHRLPGSQKVVDTYLTYHYGIKPALQDVAGAVQTLTRQPVENTRMTAKGSYGRNGRKVARVNLGDPYVVMARTNWVDSCRVFISATRREESRADDLRWALGLDDPLSTAWEITPFSFVADWVFPIGDWLAAVNASKHYTDWQVCCSQYLKETTEYSGASETASGVNNWSQVSGKTEIFHVKRTVGTRLPMVGIPFKNPVSVDHMAKGLSLLASTLARGGEPPRYLRY